MFWEITLLMGALSLTVFLQVWTRYISQNPLYWTDELARYLFIWITMLGGAIGLKRRVHLSIDEVVNMLPPIFKRIVKLLNNLIIANFLVFFIIGGIRLYTVTHDQPSVIMHIPIFIVYISAPIAGLLSLMFLLGNFFDKSTSDNINNGGDTKKDDFTSM